MKKCIKNPFPLPALIAGLGLILANRVTAQTSDGMVLIPAGSFTMGNSIGDSDITDATPTSIYVSAFYMDTNLVSYSEWQTVYSWATSYGYAFDDAGGGKAANHPVIFVNWYDEVKWCNARSEMAGLTPVYHTDGTQATVYRTGDIDLTNSCVNWSANGYRLPTEAEWEKAARGGAVGQRFPWSDANTIDWSRANYYASPGSPTYDVNTTSGNNPAFTSGGTPYTSPVGSFAPNGYGLYDMAGNVKERCWDWYGTPYGQPTATDPTGPATGSYRVLRGGSWYSGSGTASFARCAHREANPPTLDNYSHGFRCVRVQLRAPIITNITMVGATPQFEVLSTVGLTNQIQYSTNLSHTNWVVLTNLLVAQSPYRFVDAGATPAPHRFYRVAALPAGSPPPIGMALIPAGVFTMGDTLDGDSRALPISVTVSAFYMDVNLVSYSQWQPVYNWATNHGYGFDHTEIGRAHV